MAVEAAVPRVDFSILGNLPDTWQEAQSGAMRRRALEQLGTNPSAEQLGSTASLLMQAGDDKSLSLGLLMMKRADEMRKTQQEEQAIRNVSGGGGVPSGPMPSPGSTLDPRGLTPYIRERAAAYGIDPNIAVRVAMSEGLRNPVGDSGKSGGALQLYTGGGLGNEFKRDTGLDPLDPANEKATIDYGLKRAAQGGWGPWVGARKIGLGQWTGITPPEGQGPSLNTLAGRTIAPTQIAQAAPQAPQAPARFGPPSLEPDIQQRIDLLNRNVPRMSSGAQGVYKEELKALYDVAKPTESQKDYRDYLREGGTLNKQDWQANQEGLKAEATHAATQLYKQYGEARELGIKASEKIASLGELEALMKHKDFISGAGTGLIVKGGQLMSTVAGMLGAQPEQVAALRGIRDKTALMEAFKATANQLTLTALGGRLGAQLSDPDRVFTQQIFPSLTTSQKGNEMIVFTQKKFAEREREIANATREYMSKPGRKLPQELDDKVEAIRNKPLFIDTKGNLTPDGERLQAAIGEQTAPRAGPRIPNADAIKALQDNPGRANEFDSYYGPGSAAKYIRPPGGT